jgi:hypothetical protein
MDSILLSAHNIVRWLVLLFCVLSLFTGLRGFSGKRAFTDGDKRTMMFFMISCDIQLLLGLCLYFMKGYYRNFSGDSMGAVMRDGVSRFWTVEHTIGMLMAIIFVHIGYSKTKGKASQKIKFRTIFWCSFLAMIIFIVLVPWPFRIPGIARPLVPGMSM